MQFNHTLRIFLLTPTVLLHACTPSSTTPVATATAPAASVAALSPTPELTALEPTPVTQKMSPSPASVLSEWQGTYTFSQVGPPNSGQVMEYEITIYHDGDTYLATVNRDGFQTLSRLLATVQATGDNRIGVYFSGYGEGNVRGNYSSGDLLLQLERLPGDRIKIIWGAISSLVEGETETEPDDLRMVRPTTTTENCFFFYDN